MIQPKAVIGPEDVEEYGQIARALMDNGSEVSSLEMTKTSNSDSVEEAKSEENDADKSDSAKCMELKRQYHDAVREKNDAWKEYEDALGDLKTVSERKTTALENLKKDAPIKIASLLIRGIRTGTLSASIEEAQKLANDIKDFAKIVRDAWILSDFFNEEQRLHDISVGKLEYYDKIKGIPEKIYLSAEAEPNNCKVHDWAQDS